MMPKTSGLHSPDFAPLADFRAVRTLRNKMRASWKAADLDGVITSGGELLALQPDNAWAAEMRLRAAIQGTDADMVVECGRQAGLLVPDALAKAVKRLVKLGRLADAADVILASGTSPAQESVAAPLAELLLRAGAAADKAAEPAKAEPLYLAGQALAPDNKRLAAKVAALRRDAVVAALAVDPDTDAQAYVDAWTRVVELDPDNARACKRLAIASDRCQDYGAATHYWGRLVEMNPDDAVARARYTRAALRTGRVTEALETMLRAGIPVEEATADPRLVKLVSSAVAQALADRQFKQALSQLGLLSRINADQALFRALSEKAKRLMRVETRDALADNRETDAARLAQSLLAIDPDNAYALRVLARLAYRFRNYERANAFAERLVACEGDVEAHRVLLARIRAYLVEPDAPATTRNAAAAEG